MAATRSQDERIQTIKNMLGPLPKLDIWDGDLLPFKPLEGETVKVWVGGGGGACMGVGDRKSVV